jgi:hypothetical protein
MFRCCVLLCTVHVAHVAVSRSAPKPSHSCRPRFSICISTAKATLQIVRGRYDSQCQAMAVCWLEHHVVSSATLLLRTHLVRYKSHIKTFYPHILFVGNVQW